MRPETLWKSNFPIQITRLGPSWILFWTASGQPVLWKSTVRKLIEHIRSNAGHNSNISHRKTSINKSNEKRLKWTQIARITNRHFWFSIRDEQSGSRASKRLWSPKSEHSLSTWKFESNGQIYPGKLRVYPSGQGGQIQPNHLREFGIGFTRLVAPCK